MHELDDQLESLSNSLRAVQSNIATLKEAESDLKARIRALLGDRRGTIKANGKDVLSVTYRKVWNEAQALLTLEPQAIAMCSETVLSSKLCRELLSPALYAECQVESETPVITPKVAASP